MNTAQNINFDFIHKLEGSSLSGYVPCPESSHSGVTIAAGFDIGQCSVSELTDNLSTNLSNKLLPYVGKKRHEADAFVKQHPLQISTAEACELNIYSANNALQRITKEWNHSHSEINFSMLPEACATVIASVAFQYGCLNKRTPNFWQQVTSSNWPQAIDNLRNFGDKYATRRNKEADLLEAWFLQQPVNQGE